MLTRLTGTLESVDDSGLSLAVGPLSIRALAPRYLLTRIAEDSSRLNQPITLQTRLDLEGQSQGTSFTPRLIAFESEHDRAFFDLFTSVKGLGVRKAIRALAEPPATIAAWIVAKDAKALQSLPEIGKRLAETVIAELSGKVDRFASEEAMSAAPAPARSVEVSNLPPAAREAVAALLALGEQRPEAERKIEAALTSVGADADVDALVGAVFAGR